MSYEGSAHIQAVRAYLGQLVGTPTEADLKTVMGLLAQSVDKTPKDLITLTSGRRKRVAIKSIVSSAGSGSAAASTASDDHDDDHHDHDAPAETPDASPRKRAKADTTKPAAAEGQKVYDCPDWYDYTKEVKVFCFLCNAWFASGVGGVKDSHNFKSRGIGTTCNTKGKDLSEEEQTIVALTTDVKTKLIAKLGNRAIVPKPWSCEASFKLIKDVVEFMIVNHLDMEQWAFVHITGDDGEFPRTPHYKITVKEPKETKTKSKHAALEHFED